MVMAIDRVPIWLGVFRLPTAGGQNERGANVHFESHFCNASFTVFVKAALNGEDV